VDTNFSLVLLCIFSTLAKSLSPTPRATEPGRKLTSVVLVLSSQQTTFTTYHLRPTRTEFNLGTPRFEIPSYIHSITQPVII